MVKGTISDATFVVIWNDSFNEGELMKEFLQYTASVLAEDFRAQLAPFKAIYNFISRNS